tara:strand:- start:53 stop:1288 length:1236 start_codon:yes stop_codon:yes gene_type:complete
MPIYDYIIVGGGISGLFITYQLMKSDKDILLIESDSEFGGRIRTQYKKNFQVEKGAGRFSENHHKLLKLIKELNLQDEIFELSKDFTYIYKDKKIKFNRKEQLKDILLKSKKYNQKCLKNITLFQLCVDIYDDNKAQMIQSMFGYDAEFIKMNAFSAIEMFKKDLLTDDKYFILKTGFSSIIQKLTDLINESDNVTVLFNKKVTDVQDKKIKISDDEIYRGLKIILTIPYYSLKELSLFQNNTLIDSVTPIPLLRIYARYPLKNGKVWFQGLEKVITDNYIRFIIPINEKDGTIMISYTDLYNADYWYNWYQCGEDKLTEMLHKEIKSVLKINPPKPLEYKVCYWKGGVHMWKSGKDMNQIYRKILKPFDDKQIYLCNEAYSKHQCWVEGSLLMANDLLKKINSKKKTLKK